MPRIVWAALGLVLLTAVVLGCLHWGRPATVVAVVFGVFPDVSLVGAFAAQGRLKPSRVPLYNALHRLPAPIAIFAIGVLVVLATGVAASSWWPIALAGLAWVTHIAVDRACGFGLRDSGGNIIPVGSAS